MTDRIGSEVSVSITVPGLTVSNGVDRLETEVTKKPINVLFFSVVAVSSESCGNVNRPNESPRIRFWGSFSGAPINKNGNRTKQANVLRRQLFFSILALFSQNM